MKILFPFDDTNVGGSFTSAAIFISRLKKLASIDVIVVLPRKGRNYTIFKELGLEPIIYKLSQRQLNWYRNPRSVFDKLMRRVVARIIFRKAKHFLRENPVDIIHVNAAYSIDTWGKVAKSIDIPVVWHARMELGNRKDGRHLAASQGLVLCADILKNRFQPYPNCPPIEVVYDMVDVNKFKPCVNKELKRKSLGITSDKLTIGFVGNYVPRKRPEWIIRATNQLIKEGLSVQLILIGVDYSNGSYGKLLSKMAKDEGNHSDIHLVGYQSNVNEWMQAMDIFTLTSVAKGEAFPFTIIEAMSTGVPVVSTNVAGVPESVVHQETGLLSSTESYDDFYGNLKYLCQNKELRLKLGRSSRERVIEQFSIESLDKKIKKDMVSFYRQLLHNGK